MSDAEDRVRRAAEIHSSRTAYEVEQMQSRSLMTAYIAYYERQFRALLLKDTEEAKKP